MELKFKQITCGCQNEETVLYCLSESGDIYTCFKDDQIIPGGVRNYFFSFNKIDTSCIGNPYKKEIDETDIQREQRLQFKKMEYELEEGEYKKKFFNDMLKKLGPQNE